MKTLTLLSFILFFMTNMFSQENNNSGLDNKIELGNYIFTSSYETNFTTNFNGSQNTSSEKTIHQFGSIVKVIKITDKNVIIQYLKFNNNLVKNKKFYYEVNNTFLKYYKIKIDDFIKVTTRYYSVYKGAIAGLYSIPFKLRFNDFDFEQDLNLGVSIGIQYRLSKKIDNRWILEPNIGIGLTKVNLNNQNSDVIEARSASAFTWSLGMILRFSQKINLGVFVGRDFLSKLDSNTNWKHNGKTWLGLGLNIGLSTSGSKDSVKEKNK